MRKIGLIAAIAGAAIVALSVALRLLGEHGPWIWLSGSMLLAGATATLAFARFGGGGARPSATGGSRPPGADTARLLDNF